MPKKPYGLSKRVTVIVFALTKDVRSASQLFDVSQRTIYYWLKQYKKDLLEASSPDKGFKDFK